MILSIVDLGLEIIGVLLGRLRGLGGALGNLLFVIFTDFLETW
jgi:hypothetical protein